MVPVSLGQLQSVSNSKVIKGIVSRYLASQMVQMYFKKGLQRYGISQPKGSSSFSPANSKVHC